VHGRKEEEFAMKAAHVLALSLVAACGAPTNGAVHPSAAQYQANAAREEVEAKKDRDRYDPNARTTFEHCVSRRDDAAACWTEDYNPTVAHLEEARKHQRTAAHFRQLSQVMLDVEARECSGLSEHDRDTSPFAHVQDIINIEPLDVSSGKGIRREGAAFTFRPIPGMRLEWFQQVVRCHVARNDAMGHDVPDMAYCPLVPPNVQATVKQTELGFVVEVSSGTRSTITEILRRADALQRMRARRELPAK
jgi:hypothetical protein